MPCRTLFVGFCFRCYILSEQMNEPISAHRRDFLCIWPYDPEDRTSFFCFRSASAPSCACLRFCFMESLLLLCASRYDQRVSLLFRHSVLVFGPVPHLSPNVYFFFLSYRQLGNSFEFATFCFGCVPVVVSVLCASLLLCCAK